MTDFLRPLMLRYRSRQHMQTVSTAGVRMCRNGVTGAGRPQCMRRRYLFRKKLDPVRLLGQSAVVRHVILRYLRASAQQHILRLTSDKYRQRIARTGHRMNTFPAPHLQQQTDRNTPPPRQIPLYRLDPRARLLCAGTLGVLVWQAPPLAVAAYALLVAALFLFSGTATRAGFSMARPYLWFVLLWAGVKLAADTAGLGPAAQATALPAADRLLEALPQAGLMALRLMVLIGIGLLLTLTGSPRSLGLAMAWFLKPVLGRRAWHAALSLALMVHFLPLIQKTVAQVRQAIRLRAPRCTAVRRWLLIPQATLRVMSQKTWAQTVAVAARGLDSPDAWEPDFPRQPGAWCLCGLFLLLAAAPVWLPFWLDFQIF